MKAFALRHRGVASLAAIALGVLLQGPALADGKLDPGMLKSLALEEYKTIKLQDENGKALTVDEFNSRVAARKPFNISKNTETSTAILSFGKATAAPTNTIGLPEGSKMPALKLTDTQGRVRTWEEFGDKPVLLNFFFAECPPCIQEVPTLNSFAKSNPEIAVLSVTYENNAATQKFISKHGLQWPAVTDGREFVNALGIKAYPTLLLVAPDRTLKAVKTGGLVMAESKNGLVFSLDVWVRQNLK